MGIPEMRDPNRDFQNGRIARLEIAVDRLIKRMWLIGAAEPATQAGFASFSRLSRLSSSAAVTA
jgi:hypothetical protein